MNHPRAWTQEEIDFLIANKEKSTRELTELLEGNFHHGRTFNSLVYKRTQLGLYVDKRYYKKGHTGGNIKPVGTERGKKGYIWIKVAEPNVWELKQKWIYRCTYPGSIIGSNEQIIFLDGNKRNFDPKNLWKVTKAEILKVNHLYGGIPEGSDPELTKTKILLARFVLLKIKRGRQFGLVSAQGSLREEIKIRAREKRKDPEVKRRQNETARRCYQRLKQDPVRFAEYQRKHREYLKGYYKKKKDYKK